MYETIGLIIYWAGIYLVYTAWTNREAKRDAKLAKRIQWEMTMQKSKEDN